MCPDQETGRNIRITHGSSVNDPIRGQLGVLRSKGDYLIRQLPSDVDDDFFIGLEGLINALYTDLDRELISGKSQFKTRVLEALMRLLDEEILPAVSEWSTFAKRHPNEHRPRELFKNMKSIGSKIRDLHRKI